MPRIALLRTADDVQVVQYQTVDGWHRFTDQRGELRICEANAHVQAYPLPSLVDLLPLHELGRRTRKKLFEALGGYSDGVRFFEAVQGGGVVELPLGNVANGWRDIAQECINLCVTEDERGTAVVNLHAVQAMRDDLGHVGVIQSMVDRFVVSLVNVVRAGPNSQFLKPAFQRYIFNPATSTMLFFVGLGLGMFFGIDLGSHPAIASWWYGYDAGGYVVPALMGLGAWIYLRRSGAPA